MRIKSTITCWVVVATLALLASVAEAKTNPFDEICVLVAQSTEDISADCSSKGAPELSYLYSFGFKSEAAERVLAGLVNRYGEPDSLRGNAYVWRVENPIKSAKQKDTVTIILTHDPEGESAIMMDRVRPGTITATDKKAKKQKHKKLKLKNRKPIKKKDDAL